jgi:hypothetical protein
MEEDDGRTEKLSAIVRWIFVFIVFFSMTISQIAFALPSAREEQFAEYGIIFYNPDGNESAGGMFCGGRGPTNTTGLTGNSNEQKVANFLMGQGFTAAQAAGVIGNGMQESGLWPLALSASGSYFGIFQWGGSRLETLRQKMIDSGYGEYAANAEYRNQNNEMSKAIPQDVIDDILGLQLEYAIEESPNRYNWVDKMKSTTTVEEATEAFLYWFEGAVAGENAQTEDNLMRYYETSIGLYYQEARQRREYALSVAGEASGSCGLVTGGMTVEQAKSWLSTTGYNDYTNDLHSTYQLPGYNAASWCGFPGPKGSRTNCVGFSTYFVRAHTSIADAHFTLAQSPGNGNKFVGKLLGIAPSVAYGTEPQPYAVFSMGGSSNLGHTGVVVGVDETSRTVVTVEAGCATNGGVSTGATVKEYSFEQMAARYGGDVQYAYLMPFVGGM